MGTEFVVDPIKGTELLIGTDQELRPLDRPLDRIDARA